MQTRASENKPASSVRFCLQVPALSFHTKLPHQRPVTWKYVPNKYFPPQVAFNQGVSITATRKAEQTSLHFLWWKSDVQSASIYRHIVFPCWLPEQICWDNLHQQAHNPSTEVASDTMSQLQCCAACPSCVLKLFDFLSAM